MISEFNEYKDDIPYFLPREVINAEEDLMEYADFELMFHYVPVQEIAPSIFNFNERGLVANGRQNSDPFECSICFETRDPQRETEPHFRTTNCGPHRFCFPCIDGWNELHRSRMESTTCPNCRSNIVYRNERFI
jgi:hypothetical protein